MQSEPNPVQHLHQRAGRSSGPLRQHPGHRSARLRSQMPAVCGRPGSDVPHSRGSPAQPGPAGTVL